MLQAKQVRLDVYVAAEYGLSRSRAARYIEEGNVTVNGKVAVKRYCLRAEDIVNVVIPEPELYEVLAEEILLDIVYEDIDIIVVNKPRNMVVHPAPGHFSGTLVNALLYHCKDLSGVGGVLRPGIVHRLDKDTSGLIVVAKNDKAHQGLSEQLADRSCQRIYWAIVRGRVGKDSFTIDKHIGRHHKDRKKMAVVDDLDKSGRTAITHITVLGRSHTNTPAHSLIEARLETGRTHQIRVHMAHIGHPVLGDPVYGQASSKIEGQVLHAKELQFKHPITREDMRFNIELPDYFKRVSDRFDF